MTGRSKGYWEDVAEEFDTFYRKEKDALRRVIDKLFRKGMTERLNYTLQECESVDGKKVLDIGCGSGRITIELAKRGAHVVGVDSSQSMLEIASSVAKKCGVENRCSFIRDDFLNHTFNEDFHISIALGFFDYTEDPAPHLKKMRSLTKEKCIMSFPAKFTFQVPIRMIWLKSRELPVYFYTKRQIRRLLSSHFSSFRINYISALFLSVGFV